MKTRLVIIALVTALLSSVDTYAKRPASKDGNSPIGSNQPTVTSPSKTKRPAPAGSGSNKRPPKHSGRRSHEGGSLKSKLAPYTDMVDFGLAVGYEDNVYVLPYSFWNTLTPSERESLNSIGVILTGENFFIAILLEDDAEGQVDWATALESEYLPDKEAGELMAMQADEINKALTNFGGTALSPFYWTKTSKDDNTAWQIDVDGGFVYGYRKDLKSAVRGVIKVE